MVDALDPENSPDFDLLLKHFRSIARGLSVSKFKSWFLWSRYYIFGTINLYEAYSDVLKIWKLAESYKATLQKLIDEIEGYGIYHGAGN